MANSVRQLYSPSSMFSIVALLSHAVVSADLQNVLVLGGNGFIGSECVTALLATGLYNVTLLSRGSAHYDTAERVFPHVRRLTCDRYPRGGRATGALRSCASLAAAHSATPRWDFVVDFSGYDSESVNEALNALGDKIGHYVFISSDSVYEVCEPHTGVFSPEEAAVRPSDRHLRRYLAKRDSYGDGKLAAEGVLRKRAVKHVVLRLPDVIGPRDTTRRWWLYQLWIQNLAALRRAVPIPPSVRHLRTSYVFVSDVARAMVAALERADRPEVNGQAFNLGLQRPFTLKELLTEIARELGVTEPVTVDVTDENVPRFLPSVYRGPVSYRRASRVLGFEPTPWPEVLRQTVLFYRQALIRFPAERKKVFGTLVSLFEDPETRHRLVQQVEKDLLDDTFGKREEL